MWQSTTVVSTATHTPRTPVGAVPGPLPWHVPAPAPPPPAPPLAQQQVPPPQAPLLPSGPRILHLVPWRPAPAPQPPVPPPPAPALTADERAEGPIPGAVPPASSNQGVVGPPVQRAWSRDETRLAAAIRANLWVKRARRRASM
jgi:hypothetical protein